MIMQFTVAYHAWKSEAVDKALEEAVDKAVDIANKYKEEIAAGESEVPKETDSFGIETEAGKSNEKIKAKNLGDQEKPQNSEANCLKPVFQGKHKVGNVVSRVGLFNIGLA